MIGDDIVNDVGGAQQCGMRALQVRTGKYRSVLTLLLQGTASRPALLPASSPSFPLALHVGLHLLSAQAAQTWVDADIFL